MFGNVLKQLREKSGLSQEQLGEILGISKSTVGMYEQGKRSPKTDDILKKIAAYFGVSIDYLLCYDSNPELSMPIGKLGVDTLTLKDFPMLGNIACGVPITCVEQNDSYKSGSDSIRADFCLTARGNSMINANIFDGDTVYIRQQNAVINGEIAAVIVDNNDVTLKRIFYYPEKNQVILQPENPIFEPMIYSGSELESIHIIGKAVAVTHHL